TDGMDAAVYVINERQMTLTFAGANNPLVLIRGSEIQMLKANKMPVGIYARLNPFENTTIDLQKGDCIYTYSDGYQDQFGNGTDHKFMGKRLRELLLEIHQRPMAEQKDILNRTYEDWRGPASNQTDDVVIMGVRV
ncbi:MAG: SpoIIE family protein phosphatase, partial [Salinivirgaceae bacterium]|nr:SpoIIE family protein phosphatase [Salinivirgaceae bacterium]